MVSLDAIKKVRDFFQRDDVRPKIDLSRRTLLAGSVLYGAGLYFTRNDNQINTNRWKKFKDELSTRPFDQLKEMSYSDFRKAIEDDKIDAILPQEESSYLKMKDGTYAHCPIALDKVEKLIDNNIIDFHKIDILSKSQHKADLIGHDTSQKELAAEFAKEYSDILLATSGSIALGVDAFKAAQKNKQQQFTKDVSLRHCPEDKKLTARHEAAHTLIGKKFPILFDIHEVSIQETHNSFGGYTKSKDHSTYKSYTKGEYQNTLMFIMAGRAAEEIALNGDFTQGTEGDIDDATSLAYEMITEYGMSDEIGPISIKALENPESHSISRRAFTRIALGETSSILTDATRQTIESEIKKAINTALKDAKTFLSQNSTLLDRITDALLEKEILNSDEIDNIIEEFENHPPTIAPEAH